jgi:hypothetical protein
MRDEDWVLWLDADVIEYPPDIIQQLTALDLDIVHPNCVCEYGKVSFDLNAWTYGGRKHLSDLRGERIVRLQSVGGTMLLIRLTDIATISSSRLSSMAPAVAGCAIRILCVGAMWARSRPKDWRSWRRIWASSAGDFPTSKSATIPGERRGPSQYKVSALGQKQTGHISRRDVRFAPTSRHSIRC